MSKSFLILHGIANHRSPDHWQFWLAARLAAQGHQVLYPSLPDADAPTFAAWHRCLREQLAQLDGGERTVVCHSLACLLWFRAAASMTDAERVDRLLLVSPPADDLVPEEGAELRIGDFDPALVRASVRGQIRVVCSDADPYNLRGAQAMYATPLGVRADVFGGAEHITPSSGFGPWPFAEAWCVGASPAALTAASDQSAQQAAHAGEHALQQADDAGQQAADGGQQADDEGSDTAQQPHGASSRAA